MAQIPMGPIVHRTETVIRDGDEEVVRITAEKILFRHPDGTTERREIFETSILEDGSAWHVGMLTGQDRVQIAVCRTCRKPVYRFPSREAPRMGLVRLDSAITCPCGDMCCPRHAVSCGDGVTRCARCARVWRFWDIVLFPICPRR